MERLTPLINQQNIGSVRRMIDEKISSKPYYANNLSVMGVLTDMDHFPYTRYFRGVSYYPGPILFEREAGWRDRDQSCYRVGCGSRELQYPSNCFESACSTTYPCNNKTFSDREELDGKLNKMCIVQYR